MTLVIVAVPAFLCIVDALRIPELVQSYTHWCGRCCRTSVLPPAPDRGSVEVERERKVIRDLCTGGFKEHKMALAALETRTLRARQFTNCFDDLVRCLLVVVKNYEQWVCALGASPAGEEFLKLAEDFVRAAVSSCEAAMASPHVGPSWEHLITLEDHAVKISKFCFAARKDAHGNHPSQSLSKPARRGRGVTADGKTPSTHQLHHEDRFGMVDLESDNVSQLWLNKPVEFVATQLMPAPPTLVQTNTLTRIITGIINPRAEKVDLFGPGMLSLRHYGEHFTSTRSKSGKEEEDEKKGAGMQASTKASDSFESKGGGQSQRQGEHESKARKHADDLLNSPRGARGGWVSSLSAPPADAESKTVLQIHDASELGVEMVHVDNPAEYVDIWTPETMTDTDAPERVLGVAPTCHLDLWSHGGGEEKESRNGVLLQGGNKIDDSDDSSVIMTPRVADDVDPGDHTVSVQVVGSEAPQNGGSGGGDESGMAVHRVDDDDDDDDDDDETSSVCFAETANGSYDI